MYYVNREQIERRLNVLPELEQVFAAACSAEDNPLILRYAEERALHLAIEVVTDVGSYLIDGFIMRDASSYEDIIDIMRDEKVIGQHLFELLTELVRLRKPLVQEYFEWDRSAGHALARKLPQAMEEFAANVRTYLDKENIPS
ncbi:MULTISPECIES: DUF86 domain-containing protein [Paenibacillus]|uniref:DUF86 domain-containing protein n=1 Tax=Paenibacillus TaxID=44249 RepID=UPI002FE2CA58